MRCRVTVLWCLTFLFSSPSPSPSLLLKVKAFPVLGLDRVFALGLSGLTPGGWPMLAVVQSAGGERGYGLTITENDGVDGVWGAEEVRSMSV